MLAAGCIGILAAACSFFPDMVPDELPQYYEPVDWNDDLIMLATNSPCQVQIWDTKTRRLIRQYQYPTTNLLYIEDMAVSGERFWAVMVGNQRQLIQVNVATGEWKKINLDIPPINIGYSGDYLWVFTLPNPREGVYVRQLNRDGGVVRSLHILHDGLEYIDDNGIEYVNGEYLMTGFSYLGRITDKFKGYCLINLSKPEDEAAVTVPVENIFPPGFLEKTVYDANLPPPHPSGGVIYLHRNGNGLAEKAYVSAYRFWRWICRIESYDPLRLSDPVVTVHHDGDRSTFYLGRTEQNIFIAGRLLTQLSYDPDYIGLEAGVYPAEGGAEIKAMRMWESNQITYARKNGETWFGKNIWIQNPANLKWDYSGAPEAYMLDEVNARLYKTSADGTSVEIPPVKKR